MCCGTQAGSYLRLIDSCITHIEAQGPSRTCKESKEEEEEAMELIDVSENWEVRSGWVCQLNEPTVVFVNLMVVFVNLEAVVFVNLMNLRRQGLRS